MKRSLAYIILVGGVFCAFVYLLNFRPRTAYSSLEKRDLAEFPVFSADSLWSGSYTSEISSWYSDTEPYRDSFLMVSMRVKDLLSSPFPGDDNIRITAAEEPAAGGGLEDGPESDLAFADSLSEDAADSARVFQVEDFDGVMKIAHAGIMVLGKAPNARALMSFHAKPPAGKAFAGMCNEYSRVFEDSVRVYCMPVPIAIEFYCPEEARKYTYSQKDIIDNILSCLDSAVTGVNIYHDLAGHVDEKIYMYTDHHWSPLGAYYAAARFAAEADVPFADLTHYTADTIRCVVGSMFGYSHDISIKKSPEDFIYYIPDTPYTTYETCYFLNRSFKVTGETKMAEGRFFHRTKDGNGGAYCTFMGGDSKLVRVETGVGNGRRLLIIKDSFGNAVPGYMFFSFEQVHVADFRYFKKNMKDYVCDNRITDILFIQNVMNAVSAAVANSCRHLLYQKPGQFARPDTVAVNIAAPADTAVAPADSAAN